MHSITLSAAFFCVALHGAVSPIGRVNGVPVFQEDLARIPKDGDVALSDFDRLVLFRLALEQAQKEKLDQLPDVKHELDLVVYRQFLNRKLKAESSRLHPTAPEVKVYYEQRPLLRLRHLVLRFANPSERTNTVQKADRIDALLGEGKPFAKVAQEYSEDDTAFLGGDIGERGVHNLHEDFYLPLLELRPDQVSTRIESRTGIHYFQLVSRVSFQNAQAHYVNFLTKQLAQDRERRFLTSVLTELKQNARIEILHAAKSP